MVAKLVGKGLVEKLSATHGPKREQGVTYRVPALSQPIVSQPKTSQPATTHNKETHIKETHTNTDGMRGVRSRFSLKECRKYAESLRAEGIQNPGGYATKIYRSGEADELIERFLNPPALKPTR